MSLFNLSYQLMRKSVCRSRSLPSVALLRKYSSYVGSSGSSLHQLPELSYDPDLGLEPIFSSKALQLSYSDFLKHWVDSLNRMVVGSSYQSLSLQNTIATASKVAEDRIVYTTASQIFNSKLALDSLSKRPVEMNEALHKLIVSGFGSVENLKQELVDSSNNLFGGGFLWLVYQNAQLKVLVTPNAENPMYPFQPNLDVKTHQTNVGGNNVPQPICSPLLAINLWGYSYLLDYGLDREKYLERCFAQLDWNFAFKKYQTFTFDTQNDKF